MFLLYFVCLDDGDSDDDDEDDDLDDDGKLHIRSMIALNLKNMLLLFLLTWPFVMFCNILNLFR